MAKSKVDEDAIKCRRRRSSTKKNRWNSWERKDKKKIENSFLISHTHTQESVFVRSSFAKICAQGLPNYVSYYIGCMFFFCCLLTVGSTSQPKLGSAKGRFHPPPSFVLIKVVCHGVQQQCTTQSQGSMMVVLGTSNLYMHSLMYDSQLCVPAPFCLFLF